MQAAFPPGSSFVNRYSVKHLAERPIPGAYSAEAVCIRHRYIAAEYVNRFSV